jgi:hypothetical protein
MWDASTSGITSATETTTTARRGLERTARGNAMTKLDTLGGTILTADDVRERYRGAEWLEVLEYGNDPPPIRVIGTTVQVDTLAPGRKPWALIVEGDLVATGDLDFSTGDYAVSLLVVRGSLRARHLRFTNGANCIIEGDCDVDGVIVGRYGDESARLAVGRRLRARALLLDHVTGCDATSIDAVVMSSPGWGLPMDIEDDGHADVFVPAALDDGEFSAHRAWAVATGGQDVFLPEAHARLRAARPGPFQP